MKNRFHPYLLLILTILVLFPSATALAQEGQTTFLPSIGGYVEPPPPPPTEPTPYNVDPRPLVIIPSDLGTNDYEVLQDEPVQLTDSLRRIGVARGYITYMESREEDISKGPFVLGSYVLIFMSEAQAKLYFDAVRQSYIDGGLEAFRDGNNHNFISYEQRERIQGITFRHSYGLGYVNNVIFSTYSIDTINGRDPMRYLEIMLYELIYGYASGDAASVPDDQATPTENHSVPFEIPALPERFDIVIP